MSNHKKIDKLIGVNKFKYQVKVKTVNYEKFIRTALKHRMHWYSPAQVVGKYTSVVLFRGKP